MDSTQVTKIIKTSVARRKIPEKANIAISRKSQEKWPMNECKVMMILTNGCCCCEVTDGAYQYFIDPR